MEVILFGGLMIWPVMMISATTSPTVAASRTLMIIALIIMLANNFFFFAMIRAAVGFIFPVAVISISSITYAIWAGLLLWKHKKSREIR